MNSMFVVEKKESLVPTINLSDDEAEDDGEVVSYDENYTKELDVIEF